jgi:hypothetical protein
MQPLHHGLILCFLFQLFFSLSPLFADQFRYTFPPNISVTLEESPSTPARTLVARLKSKLGTLTNLKVFFHSSPDIRIEGIPTTIEDLQVGKEQTFSVTLHPTKKSPDEMGSWVRLGVKFVPDYEAILAAVSSPKTYPVEYARERLRRTVQTNQKKVAVYTEATRLFFSSPNAPVR